jgi:ABC-2 type transport system permease protein
VADLGAALLWVAGSAVLGMTIAVLIRSVPVAFAVGIAWAGPAEHLLQDVWDPAARFFPSLLEAFVAGETSEVAASRAAVTLILYMVAAAGLAGMSFARRDVTA